MNQLRKDIKAAINKNSAENGSDTPDFILAEYLTDCLAAYDKAVTARDHATRRLQKDWITSIHKNDLDAPYEVTEQGNPESQR